MIAALDQAPEAPGWDLRMISSLCKTSLSQTSLSQTSLSMTSVSQTSLGMTSLGMTSLGKTSLGIAGAPQTKQSDPPWAAAGRRAVAAPATPGVGCWRSEPR